MNTKFYFIAMFTLFTVGTVAGHLCAPESHYPNLAVEAAEINTDRLN